MAPTPTPPHIRFWAKVQKTDTCWLWQASLLPNGYPRFSLNGSTVYAHRFAYERANGPIAKGLEIHHLCGIRHCVNPAHMEVATHKQNIHRGNGVAGHNIRKTHCKHGHEFNDANTCLRANGSRQCIECRRIRDRDRKRKQRQKQKQQKGGAS